MNAGVEYRDAMAAAWDAVEIHDGPDVFLATFAAVPPPMRDLVAARWVVSEVVNGALPQFFSNSTGVLAPEAVDALRRLRLPEAADALEAAMTYFGDMYPRDRTERQRRIDWVWRGDLTDDEAHDLDLLLALSGEFLDALGPGQARFAEAANAWVQRHAE